MLKIISHTIISPAMLPALSFPPLLSLPLHTVPFVISTLINLVACAPLGTYLLVRSKKGTGLRLFALYNLCAALWSLFYLLWLLSPSSITAILFTRLLMAFATFLPLLYFLFVKRFLKQELSKIPFNLVTLLFVSFAALCLVSDYIVAGIAARGGFVFWPVAGPFLAPLLSLWFATLLVTLFLLARAAHQTSSPRRRGQMLTLLAGNIIAYVGGATNFFLWYNVPIPPWGNSAVLAVPLATLYAVAAYRLFDLRLFIKRTIVYTGLFTAILLICAFPTTVLTRLIGQSSPFSVRDLLINVFATVFIGLNVGRFHRYLTNVMERSLFRKERERRVILQEVLQQLNTIDSLEEALDLILNGLYKAFELDRIAVVLLGQKQYSASPNDFPQSHVQQIGYSSPHRLAEADLQVLRDCFLSQIQQDSKLNKASHKAPLIRSVLAEQVEYERRIVPVKTRLPHSVLREHYDARTRYALAQTAAQTLARLDAGVAVPLFQEDRLIGVLLLSPKEVGISFTDEELSLIDLVAAQAISAIQKARLFEEDKTKGEFVSMASHELLTPIASMEGYLSLVLEDKHGHIDDQVQKYLGNVNTSVKRLSTLVKDLLSVSRIESGRMSFQPQMVDLNQLVEEAIAQLRFTAKDKGLEMHFTPTGRRPLVWVDQERMMQVLINLLSNAIKYTQNGSVEVTVTNDSRLVRLSVRDTGLGMSREQMPHLFQKFSRIATAETASISGTGLGLYITKSLVEKMGGRITVTSALGKGSIFTVNFPLPISK